MRISDWSSDVCSSDLDHDLALDEWPDLGERRVLRLEGHGHDHDVARLRRIRIALALNPEAEFSRRLLRIFCRARADDHRRSEESRVGKEWFSTCRSRGSRYN